MSKLNIQNIDYELIPENSPLRNYVVKNTSFIDNLIDDINEEDYQNVFKEHLGHSCLMYDSLKDIIKMTSSKGGYSWNTSTLLWEEKDISYFNTLVMDKLSSKILGYMNMEKNNNDLEKLSRILIKVRKIQWCKDVFETLKPRLINSEFEAKLNSSPHELPIKGPNKRHLIIDLKTLKTRERTKNDLFSFELDVEFLKNDKLENANKFFSQIMGNDKEVIEFLQKMLGYTMTGETDLRCFFIMWGNGANGKSVVCDLMKTIMKKMFTSLDKKVMIKKNDNSSHTAHLIPLLSARLGVLSETNKDDELEENTIKALTGNDSISMRKLYGEQFDYTPKAKYILLTNNKPIINSNDQALHMRVVFIPFGCRFVDNPTKPNELLRDTQFVDDLKTKYLNEVFTWLCIGANNYYNNRKLILPNKIKDATNKYINEQDKIQCFIDEKLEIAELSKIKRSELFTVYEEYCKSQNLEIMKKKDFFDELERKGFEQKKIKGEIVYKGYQFKINFDDDDENE